MNLNTKYPIKLSPESRIAMRDHIRSWIHKYGRLDKEVVDFMRLWSQTENIGNRYREAYPPPKESKKR